MKARTDALRGLRILVVEDEALILMEIEDMLLELGCDLVGAAPTVAKALAAIGANELDGVLLDMNLGGEHVLPVAEMLSARGVPYLMVTGYAARSGISPRLDEVPRLTKPFSLQSLGAAMTDRFVAHG
ncbi:response regulator [Salinarimonas ramus]|uniref:Response regulator n=1 Tax=Salinarimonas ramus TaxID=690164 RepID=A0A917Q9Y2_9HYPH|nr:response regulator [Salinarimonas ramus]GGK38591.1 response regulator [Salinarimonas ramus]